jgi:uncharacterized protein (DUF1800 family)
MPTIPSLNSSIKKYRGKWQVQHVKHLLKRTMFGATKEDISFFQSQSLSATIDTLLNSEISPLPQPINDYTNDTYQLDKETKLGETWVNAFVYDGNVNSKRRQSYKSWWMGLMLNQNRSITEKMVLFWHNHFATETGNVDNAIYCYRYNMLLKQYALGNFKEFTKAMTKDMAMLKYLNGTNNVKKAPDENYGRELQELFTVGKGPGSHYTEGDVKAAARVLTGFRNDNKNYTALFDASRHDETDKQFSAFYNNTIIKGRKGKEGEQELDDLLNMIFATEEVSKFICRKLYRYFVYHQIDDITEKNIIEPIAKTFRKNNYEIKPVLKQLLSSKHFFDVGNYGGIIKSPVDFIVGACREFKVIFPTEIELVDRYAFWNTLQNQALTLQQNIGDPPNVAGWQAYYQAPQYDKIWISSDTLPKRNIFTDKLILDGYSRNKKKIYVDVIAFAQSLNNPANPDELINESVQLLYMMDLPDKEKKYMKEGILLSGLQGMMSDHYWTDAWDKLTTKPDDSTNKKDVTNKLKKLYQYLMNLPQYQLM